MKIKSLLFSLVLIASCTKHIPEQKVTGIITQSYPGYDTKIHVDLLYPEPFPIDVKFSFGWWNSEYYNPVNGSDTSYNEFEITVPAHVISYDSFPKYEFTDLKIFTSHVVSWKKHE